MSQHGIVAFTEAVYVIYNLGDHIVRFAWDSLVYSCRPGVLSSFAFAQTKDIVGSSEAQDVLTYLCI